MAGTKAYTRLIAEAAEWRLMGLLLERPREGWHEEVARLGSEMHDPKLRAAVAAAQGATQGDYLHLVGPGGVVSPREVASQPFADPGQLLAQVATCYEAFAFRPHVEEPIDHIAVEVAFVGYLLLKEAFASARGDAEAAATTAAARLGFIETHLAALAVTFAQRLENTGSSYLLVTARRLAARVPAQPPARMLSSAADVLDVCGACGVGEAY
jgi:nitrate reductase assembly molybdenum cofactor insertion protein NarJ